MAKASWLKNAPITEALLDIRVKAPSHLDLSRLASFQDAVKDQYPIKQNRVAWHGSLKLQPGVSPKIETSEGPQGYIFFSGDRNQAVQARMDGFSFSRLKPYKTWDSLRTEARELWRRYIEVVAPEAITRIALRYINRLEIPLPVRDFKEYVLTVPDIAPDLPQGLANFFMRLVLPEPSLKAMAIITETMEAPGGEGAILPMIFDIEELRTFKNDIFFGSITEKMKELFL